jgi:hypothetical protein
MYLNGKITKTPLRLNYKLNVNIKLAVKFHNTVTSVAIAFDM